MTDDWLRFKDNQLLIKGRNSLFSTYNQSGVFKRMKSFRNVTETAISFQPDNFLEMAGLTCFYNNGNFHYLRIYKSDSLDHVCLGVMTADHGNKTEYLEDRVNIDCSKTIYMKAEMDRDKLQFYYGYDKDTWTAIGPVLDATILSDEYAHGFTGAFVGVTVTDMYKKCKWASFDFFTHENK